MPRRPSIPRFADLGIKTETHVLHFGNTDYVPESITLPVRIDGKPLPEVKPGYRHARSPEEYRAMLADKTDQRPIKIFFPEDQL